MYIYADFNVYVYKVGSKYCVHISIYLLQSIYLSLYNVLKRAPGSDITLQCHYPKALSKQIIWIAYINDVWKNKL